MKNKKKIVIIASIVIAALAIGGYAVKAAKPKPKQVSTTVVAKKNLVQSITVTGDLEANDEYQTALNPQQKIVQVLVKEGQMVKKGDVLAKYDTVDYEYQLGKAQITLQSANEALNSMLSVNERSERANAENAVTQAEIALENAKNAQADADKKFSQNDTLFKKGVISSTDYDNSKKAAADAANAVKNAQLSLNNAKNTLMDFGPSSNQKISGQKSQVQSAQLDIDNCKNKIETSTIKSSIDGKVVRMDAKENEYPKSGDAVLVQDVSGFKISVEISQYDAVSVAVGQKANVKIKGIDKSYTGKVVEVGQTAQQSAKDTNKENKIKIKVAIDNPDDKIRAGYEGDADIVLNERQNVLAVGFDAIKKEKDGKQYVFVVANDNRVSKKLVKTGLETDYDVEVISGLKQGDKCILNPDDSLKDGDIVATMGGKK